MASARTGAVAGSGAIRPGLIEAIAEGHAAELILSAIVVGDEQVLLPEVDRDAGLLERVQIVPAVTFVARETVSAADEQHVELAPACVREHLLKVAPAEGIATTDGAAAPAGPRRAFRGKVRWWEVVLPTRAILRLVGALCGRT